MARGFFGLYPGVRPRQLNGHELFCFPCGAIGFIALACVGGRFLSFFRENLGTCTHRDVFSQGLSQAGKWIF